MVSNQCECACERGRASQSSQAHSYKAVCIRNHESYSLQARERERGGAEMGSNSVQPAQNSGKLGSIRWSCLIKVWLYISGEWECVTGDSVIFFVVFVKGAPQTHVVCVNWLIFLVRDGYDAALWGPRVVLRQSSHGHHTQTMKLFGKTNVFSVRWYVYIYIFIVSFLSERRETMNTRDTCKAKKEMCAPFGGSLCWLMTPSRWSYGLTPSVQFNGWYHTALADVFDLMRP